MLATVQVRIVAADLASTMRDMRMWLDHRKIAPRAFRRSSWPGGLALHIDFDEQGEAEEFAGQFGGRVLGAPPADLGPRQWRARHAQRTRDHVETKAGHHARAGSARVGVEPPNHGALSNDRGRVDLNCTLEPSEADEARLIVEWLETDGPAVASPRANGSGRAIFAGQLTAEIDADATIDFLPDGVEARIVVPGFELHQSSTGKA